MSRVCAAGLPVELSVDAPAGSPRALPPGIDLAAFRVVQEGLTNVIKHAGQARTTVHIEYRPRDLLITCPTTADRRSRPAGRSARRGARAG